ncbi:MAG: GTP-binding protein, partial [Magnetococcales bacterium]|nr:GTP-binding protein [Magnetococcales bacterium]
MEKIPLSILTGFLGSGKTTLLNHLVTQMSDMAVIINEFGEIGLDHLLLEQVQENMVELSSGCLCCTIRGDLIETLTTLLERMDKGDSVPFKRVVVETTGLADPVPILTTIMAEEHLEDRFSLDGVITVVDAVNGEGTLDRHKEAVKQVAVADRVLITKGDVLRQEAEADLVLDRLQGRLEHINPGISVIF